MQFYSEPMQKFRLAGQGLYDGPQPKNPVDRERLAKYFDPRPMVPEAFHSLQAIAQA